jgi:sRNA-binding protein
LLNDLAARSESHHKAEKEVWLRGGKAVHAFFFRRLRDPLDLKRKDLSNRLDRYKQVQLAEARAQRETEAVEARSQQREAARTRTEAEAAARHARSNKPQREQEAAAARVESDVADARAENAMLATKAKAGDMISERFEGPGRSGLVTMRKHEVVYIDDVSKLDLEQLRPFLKEEHLLQAPRAWARATNFTRQMLGAVVALRANNGRSVAKPKNKEQIMSDQVQAEIERARQIAQEFKRRFPQAFTEKPQPLKLGIKYDLIAAMSDHSRQDVLNAWTYWMLSNDCAYLRCLIDGRPRVNRQGEVVGRVTFEEHAQAAKLSRIMLGGHQLALSAQEQRARQRKYLNVIAGGRSEPDVLADALEGFDDNSDEHLTPAAQLALRLVSAFLNDDGASCHDLIDRITKLIAAYVNSEKGKKRAGSPELLMTAAVGEIAAVIAGEPLLRDAAVRYAATTVDDDPRTHEPEGGKSLQSLEHFTMADEDNLPEYEDKHAREIIRELSRDGHSGYEQLTIVMNALSMVLAGISKNTEDLLENIALASGSVSSRAKGWFEIRSNNK